MKFYRVILTGLLTIFSVTFGWSQSVSPCTSSGVPGYQDETEYTLFDIPDCNNPLPFCYEQLRYGYCKSSLNSPGCTTLDLWHYTKVTSSGILGLQVDHSSNANGLTAYEVYGPFSDLNQCTDIANSTISPVTSATFSATNQTFITLVASPGWYLIKLVDSDCEGDITITPHGEHTATLVCEFDECESCVGSFALQPDSTYVISAWASQTGTNYTLTNFDDPEIYIEFYDASNSLINTSPTAYKPSGQIIDDWQRIEEVFTVPGNAASMKIRLTTSDGDVYFDDIRIFPFNASMKSYVYDPVNMRLVAELDERHYSTFYEYDEEGKLIRIKKETEKGIMTIQETRNNNSKP